MTAQKPGQNASPLRLGIAGLGTVGTGTVKIIQKHADMLAARAGRPVAITAVSARDRMKNRDIDLSTYAWEEDARALAVRDDIDVFPSGQIKRRAGRQKRKSRLGKVFALFTGQHRIQLFTQLMQIQNI